MKRQVAGFLGYFKNIPVQHTNQSGELKNVTGVRVVASGYAVNYAFGSANNQVNSTSTLRDGDIVVYEKMVESDWQKEDGIYKFQQSVENVTITPNSWLAGRFLVPFNKDNNKSTFQIQLIGGENNEVLHTWSVKCNNYTNSTNCFDVYRNHFYMIGKKYKNNPGNDDQPDDPIDLSDDGEIEIYLSDAWDIIHDLELE